MRPITTAVIHCSATRSNQNTSSNDIKEIHRAKGWDVSLGPGYHWFIERNGFIDNCRAERNIGMHAYGFNRESLGVCLAGGLDPGGKILEGFDLAFTPEQKHSIIVLCVNLGQRYPGIAFIGHRMLSPDLNGDGVISTREYVKQCPCFDVESKFREWSIIYD